MNNLPAVDGMYPVIVGGAGLASLAVPESPRTGVYYASLGGTVVIRNVNPATVVSQLETAAASWLTSMGLAMDDPATAEMAINMVEPEAIAVSAEPQPFLKLYSGGLSDLNNKRVVISFNSELRRIDFDRENWYLYEGSPSVGEDEVYKSLVYSDTTHATLTENGYTYTFVFGTGQTVYVDITPQPLNVE